MSKVQMFSDANRTFASNIGAEKVTGYKKQETFYVNSSIKTGAGSVSYVNSTTRSTNSVQGSIRSTGVATNVAVDGNGFIIVSDPTTGESKLTRRGDFVFDDRGFLKNAAGMLLQAWKYEGDGKTLPGNRSLLDSLVTVNLSNLQGTPKKTTVISMSANLSAEQDTLRGPGVTTELNRLGFNRNTKADEILVPEVVTNTGKLTLGDTFKFEAGGSDLKSVTFGGLVVGNKIINSPIYGKTDPSQDFNFSALQSPTTLKVNDQLKIKITGGQEYTFTAVNAGANAAAKSFSSLNNLALAINNISTLSARVVDGRLYVAPQDASKGLEFAGGNGGTIHSALGLANLEAETPGRARFNSLKSLEARVKGFDQNLNATIEADGNIKITSKLAESRFTITGESFGIRKITSATLGDGSEKLRATVTIHAPANQLSKGNYVRINDLGGATMPAGIYMVSRAGDNSFDVHLVKDTQATAAGIPLAVAAAPVALGAVPTWQKVAGKEYAEVQGAITATGAQGGPSTADITLLPGHGILLNDVVYLSGGALHLAGADVSMPAGYYRVTVVAGQVITVAVNTVAAAVLNAENGAALQVRKIGTTLGLAGQTLGQPPVGTFDTALFDEIDVPGKGRVARFYAGTGHTYTDGDVISFNNLPGGLLAVGNFNTPDTSLKNDIKYVVVGDNTGNGYVDFKVINSATGVVVEPGAAVAPLVVGALSAVQLSALGANLFQANNFSRMLEYFNLNNVAKDADSTIDKSYDPQIAEKNLSGPAFDSSQIFDHSLTVIDSVGISRTIILKFAKLSDAKWAVEVTSLKDEKGNYNLTAGNPGNNGVVHSGTIDFNTDGTFKQANGAIDNPMEIKFEGNPEANMLEIDWKNELSPIKSGSFTQYGNASNVGLVQNNGQQAGTLTKTEVSPEGDVVGTFSTGESRKLFKIAMGTVANYEGLIAGANDTYEVSRESGELLLKGAGVGGAGQFVGAAVEDSNVDLTSELIGMQENTNAITVNARAESTKHSNLKNVLSELRG